MGVFLFIGAFGIFSIFGLGVKHISESYKLDKKEEYCHALMKEAIKDENFVEKQLDIPKKNNYSHDTMMAALVYFRYKCEAQYERD